jgi:hypothetical protein
VGERVEVQVEELKGGKKVRTVVLLMDLEDLVLVVRWLERKEINHYLPLEVVSVR